MADHTLNPKNTQEYLEKAIYTAKFINEQFGHSDLAIVLGSGLNNFTDELTDKKVLEFHEIPYFPQPTVKGHSGKFVAGKVGDRRIFCLAGRVHSYEGRYMYELTFIVRVLALSGVKLFVATNASGGAGEGMYPGCLMIIKDHINCYRRNPLNDISEIPLFGENHPDLSHIYSERVSDFAKQTASQLNIKLFEGIYGGTSGPTYETPSEVKGFHKFGVSAFGMSTMPETMAAFAQGMEVFGISLITNMAAGLSEEVLTHQAVTSVAAESGPNFIRFMKKFLSDVKSDEKFGKPRENKSFDPTPLPLPFVAPASSEQIEEVVKLLENHGKEFSIAILLSEGHDSLLDRIHDKKEIPYAKIPHFTAITPSRKGKFVFGTLNSKKVVVLAGNSLEGFACEEATFIVELLHALGVHTIVQTFLSGTVSEEQKFPRILALKDANDSTTTHPIIPSSTISQYLTGTKLFDANLIEELKKIENEISTGIYTHVPGPSYPTAAEVHTAKLFHFDTIGLTSLSVVYAARSVDIRVVGISEVAYFKPPKSVHSDGKIIHVVEKLVDKINPHSISKWKSGHRNSTQISYQLTPPVNQGDYDVIQKASSFVKGKINATAHVGVMVDIELSHLFKWDKFEVKHEIELKTIPGLTINQSGSLIFGELEGIPVYVVKGTNYLNEGYSAFQVTFLVRVLATLDAKTILFVSNVCSVDERLKIGDVAIVRDHVLLSGRSPLFGPNEERWGTRFPDVGDAYSKNFQQVIRDQAKSLDLQIQTIGIGHFTGPIFGSNADAAVARFCNLEGISTSLSPEVLTARHMSVTVGALAIATSGIYGEDNIVPVEKKINIGEKFEQLVSKVVKATAKL